MDFLRLALSTKMFADSATIAKKGWINPPSVRGVRGALANRVCTRRTYSRAGLSGSECPNNVPCTGISREAPHNMGLD